jgi:hypothetical protein
MAPCGALMDYPKRKAVHFFLLFSSRCYSVVLLFISEGNRNPIRQNGIGSFFAGRLGLSFYSLDASLRRWATR